jgi:hypothetical protein
MQADEAVSGMIELIDGLEFKDTASFYHRDGYKMDW